MSDSFTHVPVLMAEVLKGLTFDPVAPARLIDGTVGGGGHSAALLEKYPALELLGIDRDEDALAHAAERLHFARNRIRLERGDYSSMKSIALARGWERVDGILLDIGVSSPQLDRPERGFSWRADGPLDMRMDRRSPQTASRLLNRSPEAELERIFRCYGEVAKSRKLAAAVVAQRELKPFATTVDLVELCDRVLGKSRPGQLPSPTLVFQALRIAVNDELGELEKALPDAVSMLNPGGRLAVISFHSLEDRVVKEFIRDCAKSCVCPPGLPICVCGKTPTLKPVERKAIVATAGEIEKNRRAASAKLRVAEKL